MALMWLALTWKSGASAPRQTNRESLALQSLFSQNGFPAQIVTASTISTRLILL
jgi:hypothetical protein